MLTAATAAFDGSPWVVALPGLLAVLVVSTHKGWQYLLERQRHRSAQHLALTIGPEVSVELGTGNGFLRVRRYPATAATDELQPPEGDGEPTSIVPLDVRQASPGATRQRRH